MVDKINETPPLNNLKGLIQDLTEILDDRMRELLIGTAFESVRPSDAKTFMLISRQPRTISGLAQSLGISRQAAHKSVLRLVERQIVDLAPAPESKRDKIAVVTKKGNAARKVAATNLKTIEAELEVKIGKKRLESLRGILDELIGSHRQKH